VGIFGRLRRIHSRSNVRSFPAVGGRRCRGVRGSFSVVGTTGVESCSRKVAPQVFFPNDGGYICVPNYYTIETGVIPWITARRVFILLVIILFGLTVAGSKAAREKITSTLASNRLLAIAAIGFLIPLFLSILTSVNWSVSLKIFSEVILEWYVPFFACI